jgi:hypothetical protein
VRSKTTKSPTEKHGLWKKNDEGGVVRTGFQNWKTTVIGAVIAGLYALQNASNMTPKHALVVFAIAAFGFVCADGNSAATDPKAMFKVQG